MKKLIEKHNQEHSNFTSVDDLTSLTYPLCAGVTYQTELCDKAKYTCKNVKQLDWKSGGKECWMENYDKMYEEEYPEEKISDTETDLIKDKSLSTGAIVGISLGAIAVFGGIFYLILKK
tara:strand:+ start:3293 stop:3649 length:357 start_codon:yes stop_codon:yes gene_type:complete